MSTSSTAPVSLTSPWLQCGRWRLVLDRPQVVGIVNLTPDSFADGGAYSQPDAALRHAEQLLREGADVLDFGAESTRPDAAPVAPQEEWQRLQPVLHEVVRWQVAISVDTRHAQTMRHALDAGVDMINDVSGMTDPAARAAVAASPDVAVCVMHMRGTPQTMRALTQYEDVTAEVAQFLTEQTTRLSEAGVALPRICLDPGFGFAKTSEQNWRLLAELDRLRALLPAPLYVGLSRKSMLQAVTGRTEPQQRLAGSLALALAAVERGALFLRVHDVAATLDALKVWQHLPPLQSNSPT